MKQFIPLLLFLFSLIISAEAQKVKRQEIDGTCLHYPIVALPSSFASYRVTSQYKGIDTVDFNKITRPKNVILLKSFENKTALADLNIKVTIGELKLYQFASTTVIRSLNELRGYSGTNIEYTLNLDYEVTDQQGIVIQKETFINGSSFTAQPITTPSRKQSLTVSIVNSVTASANEGLQAINVRINDLFGFYREKQPLDLYTIQPSKTDKYEEYTAAVDNIEAAFKNTTDEAALQKTLLTSVEFWDKKLATFNVSDEDQKAHYFLCAYNLAATYCWLDDFTKANEYLQKALTNDYRSSYVKMLKPKIDNRNKIKEQYLAEKESNTKNPQLIYQRTEGKKESPNSIFDALNKQTAQKTEAASAYMEKGFIVTQKRDTIQGSFIEFDTNTTKGVVSFVPNGGIKKEYKKPYSEFASISLKGLVYLPDGNSNFLKLNYASPTLMICSSSSGALIFVLNKNKEEKPMAYTFYDPNDGASFVTNYKKKLAEVFKGKCDAIEKKVLDGSYDLKKPGVEPLQAVIVDFENECGSKEYEKYKTWIDTETIKKRYK